eukprot:g3836.t1
MEEEGTYYSVPPDSAAGAAHESLNIEAAERMGQGGGDCTGLLGPLYCVLIVPAYMVAFASMFAMDNPNNSNKGAISLFILASWAMLPALAISGTALACLGSQARCFQWVPPFICGVELLALVCI